MRRQLSLHLLVLSLIVWSLVSARPSVAEQLHSVTILRVDDPQFMATARTLFPDVASAKRFSEIAPFSAIVYNSGATPIRAYSVCWYITASSGKVASYGKTFTKGHEDRMLITGQVPVLRQGESQFVAPFAYWTSFSKVPHSATSGVPVELVPYIQNSFFQAARNARSVRIVLDAVLGDDHIFSGKDTLDLATHFTVERNAQHDEGLSVMHMLSANLDEAEMLKRIRYHISQQYESGNNARIKIYRQARAEEADLLIKVYEAQGRSALYKAAMRLQRAKKVHFSRSLTG